MTTKRHDGKDATEFSKWLRDQKEIDSSLGYITTNIDFLWKNWKTGEWMLIEEKRHAAEPKFFQQQIFRLLDESCNTGTHKEKYRGFYYLTFENTSPDDGLIWLHGHQITKDELLNFLQFKITIQDIIKLSEKRENLPSFRSRKSEEQILSYIEPKAEKGTWDDPDFNVK